MSYNRGSCIFRFQRYLHICIYFTLIFTSSMYRTVIIYFAGRTALDMAIEQGKISTIVFLLRADCKRQSDLMDNENIQKLCDMFPPLRTFLRTEFLEPWSLMRLCRYQIRNTVSAEQLCKMEDLESFVPRSLVEYLTFKRY